MAKVSRSALEATAHHEASHAVAAFKSVRFRLATIEAGGESAGHVLFTRRQWPRSLDTAFKEGVVARAGDAAQRRFNPRSMRRYHGQGDRDQVVTMALQWAGDERQAELLAKLWEAQAGSLVALRWPSVCAVAQALLARGSITQEEARQIAFSAPRGLAA